MVQEKVGTADVTEHPPEYRHLEVRIDTLQSAIQTVCKSVRAHVAPTSLVPGAQGPDLQEMVTGMIGQLPHRLSISGGGASRASADEAEGAGHGTGTTPEVHSASTTGLRGAQSPDHIPTSPIMLHGLSDNPDDVLAGPADLSAKQNKENTAPPHATIPLDSEDSVS